MKKKFIPIILILIILFQNLSVLMPFLEVEAASSNPITSINVTNEPTTMQIGDTVALKTEFTPVDTDDEYTLQYESSDPSVALIDSNGKIEALKEGTTTITVTSINNKTDSFEVTVTNPVTGIKILNPAARLPFGEAYTLKVQAEPSTLYNKLIKFTSSDPSVATIDSMGCFYDYASALISVNTTTPGPTTITAYVGDVKETLDLYIYPMSSWTETTAITIANKKDALKIGDTYKLTSSITPSSATNKLITYWSSDETVATVSEDGTITALKNGKTTITAKTLNYTDSYVLTVNETGEVSEITSINIIGEQTNLFPDTLFTIAVEITPEGATGNTTPTYTSSDTSVATIDSDGMIETLKPGTTTITAKVGEFTDSYVLTVIEDTTEEGGNDGEEDSGNGSTTPTTPPSVEIIANYVVTSSITGTLDANGVLTLTGTGAIPDYESGKTPWYSSNSQIKKVVVNDGITTLGKLSFQDLTKLTLVELPTSLLEIGEGVFKNCSSLTNITLNEGLTTIGLHPFEGTKLESLTIPSSVKDIRSEIGYGINTIKEYIVKEGNTEYYTHEGVLYSKPTGYNNNDLFAYPIANTRTEYTIPNGVVKIEQSALYNAKNLKKINIPDSVFMYSGYAFRGSGLTSLVVPTSNLEVLGPGVWQDCTSLKTVEFKANTKNLITGDKLPGSTFANCTSLESVVISGNVDLIYANAFENCTALKTVTFKGTTKTIDYLSFKGCTSLEEVVWPESIVSVSKTAFTGCDSLVQKYPTGFSLQDDGYYRISPINIEITGKFDYEKTKEVLKIMNEERAKVGLEPLVLDEELMQTATQRAAEIAVRYSHTRPDGSSCDVIFPELSADSTSSYACAENIAAGYVTASSVMEGWMNSPGHRRNILLDFKAVGIGCFYHNGRYFWTQCFLGSGTDMSTYPSGTTTTKMTIPVSISEIELKFNKNTLLLPVGSSQTLTVYGTHKSSEWDNEFIADLNNFNWSTSASSIVSVNNGTISGLKDGNAKITIVSKNTSKLTASLDVTSQTMCTSIYAPKSSYTITGNTSISGLGIYANPSNAKNKTLNYSIENTYYATISDGKIIPSRNGSTNLVVKTTDGSNITKKIPLTIRINCTGINISKTSITLNESIYLASLGIYATPTNAYNRTLNYKIDNTSIVKVEYGRLIPVKNGTTKITFSTADGTNISKTLTVTVDIKCSSIYAPTSISIDKDTSISTYGIVAYPSNAKNKTLNYSIENTSIAKISNGKIVRVKNGTTNLIIKTTDGSNITKKVPLTVKGVSTSTNSNNNQSKPSTTKKLPFVDVSSSAWCYSAVEYVYNKGYILGTSPTTYEPGTKLTRGMIVTILNRMEGYNIVSGSCKFPDVSSSEYYYESIKWATKVGIVHGYEDGYFRPNKPITREELAVILRNYTDYKGGNTNLTTSLNKFNDGKTVSSFAKSAVEWAVARGVITGYTDNNTIRPQGTATRDVAASMIFKYCNTK